MIKDDKRYEDFIKFSINDLKNIKNVLYPDDNEQYKDLVRVNPNLLNLTNLFIKFNKRIFYNFITF